MTQNKTPCKEVWAWLAAALAKFHIHHETAKEMIARRGLKQEGHSRGDLQEHLKTLTGERAFQSFAMEIAIGGGFYHHPEALKAACEIFGVTAGDIAREVDAAAGPKRKGVQTPGKGKK